MKFKVGDKVRVRKDLETNKVYGGYIFREDMCEYRGEIVEIDDVWSFGYELKEDYKGWIFSDEMLEPVEKYKTDAEVMQELIEGRDHKPNILEGKDMNQPIDDPIEPEHYKNGDKDLFDELYDRLYHSKKMFTGREVFIIVMKFVAERYIRRYPNKNVEDLSKGIYTLERLKEYEGMEE